MAEVSNPQKLLDAMEEARDAVQGASVEEVMKVHLGGIDIFPSEMIRRPTLLVPPKIYEAVKHRLAET